MRLVKPAGKCIIIGALSMIKESTEKNINKISGISSLQDILKKKCTQSTKEGKNINNIHDKYHLTS